jgi:hypothetical protein
MFQTTGRSLEVQCFVMRTTLVVLFTQPWIVLDLAVEAQADVSARQPMTRIRAASIALRGVIAPRLVPAKLVLLIEAVGSRLAAPRSLLRILGRRHCYLKHQGGRWSGGWAFLADASNTR